MNKPPKQCSSCGGFGGNGHRCPPNLYGEAGDYGWMQIGKYFIKKWPKEIAEAANADFFIQHEDGEGMGVRTERLEELFDYMWQEDF